MSVLVHSRDGGPRSFTADQVFINAGTRPSVPALDGLNGYAYHDDAQVVEIIARKCYGEPPRWEIEIEQL